MLRSKYLILSGAILALALTSSACSKKGPNSSGVNVDYNNALKTVHFDFDKYNIRADQTPLMQANASWLKANPNVNVIVEGNTDEVGTNEYNMALGERRSKAGKDYLTNLGVDTNRISTMSYGEERPANPGHTPDAYAQNRRDDFAVRK